MASLTEDADGRSPYWYCCYTAADGRQLKKSTKIRLRPARGDVRPDGTQKTPADTRKEAWEFCLTLEAAENMARQGTLSDQTIKRLLSSMLERTTGRGLQSVSARDWLHQWLGEKRRARSAGTAERYAQCIREFIASLGKRAGLPLDAITTGDIATYRDAQLAEGKSRSTAKQNVGNISTAFNAARRRGLITSNPCDAMEHLPVERAERQNFTPAQVASLVRAAEGDWRGAILMGFYTGARLGDIAALTWESVDIKQRAIRFTPKKTASTGKAVVVPLHPDLERELLKKPGVGKAPVFPSLIGKKTGGAHGLSRSFAKIMAHAGIRPDIIRHTAGGRRNTTLSFHSLRHAFVSALANAGISIEMRQALAGHASARMNLAYTHLELDPLRAAVSVLPSVSPRP